MLGGGNDRTLERRSGFFYEFWLDDCIPKDHLLRRIDLFLTHIFGEVRELLKSYYSEIGRPSVDPELMVRMLMVGYCYGLRSERRLTQEVELRLVAYRWFCRLDLDDKVPHGSTSNMGPCVVQFEQCVCYIMWRRSLCSVDRIEPIQRRRLDN